MVPVFYEVLTPMGTTAPLLDQTKKSIYDYEILYTILDTHPITLICKS